MATLELSGVDKDFGDTRGDPRRRPRRRRRRVHRVRRAVRLRQVDAAAADLRAREPRLSGEIRIDGQRVNDVPAADRGLAMVFQSYALYPHMTVHENMAFGLENIRTPKTEIERKVRDAARLLRLGELLRTAADASSPAASGSAWRSGARSCASRGSSCSTSRCRISMRSCGFRCAPRSSRCTGACARR